MAISVDTTSHATALDTTTGASVGITWNHTCAAGATKLVVTVGAGRNTLAGRSVATVTYNGVLCSSITRADDGNFEHSEVWQLNNPPTGASYAILVKMQADVANTQLAAGAISLFGAHENVRSASANTGSFSAANLNARVSLYTEPGDLCVDAYASDIGSVGTSTPGGTQIWEDEDVSTDSDFGSQYANASSASLGTTLTWTGGAGTDPWVLCAAAFMPTDSTRLPFLGSFGRSGGRPHRRYPLAPAPSWGRFAIPTLAERMRYAA